MNQDDAGIAPPNRSGHDKLEVRGSGKPQLKKSTVV
jgi:hypothetical protein